jgi:hypothetical protein
MSCLCTQISRSKICLFPSLHSGFEPTITLTSNQQLAKQSTMNDIHIFNVLAVFVLSLYFYGNFIIVPEEVQDMMELGLAHSF